MKEKRAEFLKLKALQSYQEAKFKRVKHIKSKRFRKIMRKEKEKQEEKNLDRLEKEDPLQFKDVLDQIEKKRMKVSLNFFI
jgi:U3 small nucleolar RNA-associated protein 14